jgi:hypothetical protein
MRATDLSKNVWNALAGYVNRSQSPREVYYATVTRNDLLKKLVWVSEFGDVAIPLVAHKEAFVYYDTVPVGNVTSGQPVKTKQERRADPKHTNANLLTEVVCPAVGDLVVIMDPWGSKRFPICIGTIQSKAGFWEGD